MRSKAELEKLIRETTLFTFTKGDENYNAEKYKLSVYLCEYYANYVYRGQFYDKNPKNYDLTTIFMDTFNSCTSSYRVENGDFLNYFNSAFSNNKQIARARDMMDEKRRGLSVPQAQSLLATKIYNYAKSNNINLNDEFKKKELAKFFGISLRELDECIRISSIGLESSVIVNDDNDEVDLVETLSDGVDRDASTEMVEAMLDVADSLISKMSSADRTVVSALFTNHIYQIMLKDCDVEYIHNMITHYKFHKDAIYKFCLQTERALTHKELAPYLKISANSANKILEQFINAISKEMKK